ncbi:hypothetical protein FOC1_g10011303 [Fusarium oxysporum f. sp. cubense race 1]|uniref:Allergen n=1 Tax=Fusarium oxysporum f. sp. cubense (strain race 1) TaxID=1229664 RepID=N4URR9_FUSC1|nr:hypothetical protein FOC1_g10011303 [Fusarium oxysporum f. sp. cubense race 1]
MEKAKQAVSSFLSNDGKHRTTVDEDVKPHVTQEHVMPHKHEQVTTALDKEVHQEHHHTTVQPITHKETLPEQHHHNLVPVEHKTFHHGNEQDTRATLDREAAKYRDTTETHSTTHSTETAPILTGERIHHHVHEHVQPVINKETVQPHVVHTTIPIHETHHAAPVHHGTSTLPTKTLEEFTQERGGLKERAAQKLTEFEGCPKPYRRELQGEQLEGDKSMHLHGHGDNYGENQAFAGREGQMGRNTEGLAAGAAAGAGAAAATRKHRHGIGHKERRGSASSSSSMSSSDEESRGLGKSSKTKNRGLGSSTGTGVGAGAAAAAAGAAHSHHQSREGAAAAPSMLEGNRGIGSNTGLHEYDQVKTGGLHNDPLNSQHARGDSGVGMQTGKKPSLIDRLNPMKDADGDGKKGLLD